MLLGLGAILSGYLGYRLLDWWVPAAVAVAVVAIQAAMFEYILGGRGTSVELYAASLVMNLVIDYATFGIGRTIGQRLRRRRKDVR
jgi:hypothetical protein